MAIAIFPVFLVAMPFYALFKYGEVATLIFGILAIIGKVIFVSNSENMHIKDERKIIKEKQIKSKMKNRDNKEKELKKARIKYRQDEVKRKEDEIKLKKDVRKQHKQVETKDIPDLYDKQIELETRCKHDNENKQSQLEINRINDIKEKQTKEYQEIKELEWAIKEEKKENKKFKFYDEPILYKGYCNYLINDYCIKYDFGPPHCDERGCTWKERRLPYYKVHYDEEYRYEDIQYEKRLTMFGEYYYEKEGFNEENYQDMKDFYSYLIDKSN